MRKIRQPPPTQGEDRLIPFLASLVAEDLSPKTVDGYRRDLLAWRAFASARFASRPYATTMLITASTTISVEIR